MFNSLRPSSSIYYLQIYCTGLIGPTSHTFWAWIVNRDPTIILSKYFLLNRASYGHNTSIYIKGETLCARAWWRIVWQFFPFRLPPYLNLAFISFKFSIYIKVLIKYIYKSRYLMCESMRLCQVVHCLIFFPFGLPPYLNLAFISNY